MGGWTGVGMNCGRMDWSDNVWEGGLEWGWCVGEWTGVGMNCGRMDWSGDDVWEGGLEWG